MIKCNAIIHYIKKTGALSSFAVRKRCSSCRHWYLLWVKIHFVHRLKLFKVKECGMTKNIIFWLWKCSEWTLQKLHFFLLDQLNVNYPRYVWFRIHFIHYCYAIDLLILRLHEYCIDLVFGKKSRILAVVDHNEMCFHQGYAEQAFCSFEISGA